MKLETKFQDEDFKLGEVTDVDIATMPDGRIKAQAEAKSGGVHTFFYDDLKTFANDWEDYEEPKEHWAIDQFGEPINVSGLNALQLEKLRRIGNLFQSEEESEKAAEKLKAWKRLKDKGFDIESWDTDIGDNYYKTGQIVLNLNNVKDREWDEYDQIMEIKNDLDLLLGGEE